MEKNNTILPRAVILAGGRGTRLRPLTVTIPKPMLPLNGRPVIMRLLDSLRKAGVHEVGIATGYLADKIENTVGSRLEEQNITYFRERDGEFLGTAGAVKRAVDFLTDEDFFVVCGDAYIELDWTAVYEFHRVSGGLATIVLTRVSEPTEFGAAVTEGGATGRIISFAEKPSWDRVVTDTVNCGIYIFRRDILAHIPDGKYDFGSQLFGALLAKGETVYGYVADGYWCDIGSPDAFYNCNMYVADKENGKKKSRFRQVGTRNAISLLSSVDPTAKINESVIFTGARIEAGASVDRAIVCEDAYIGRGATVGEGAIVGAGAMINANDRVLPRQIVQPYAIFISSERSNSKKDIRQMKKSKNDSLFAHRDDHFGDRCLTYKLSELPAPAAVELGQALAYTALKQSDGNTEPQIGLVVYPIAHGQDDAAALECVRKCMVTGLASVSEKLRVVDHGIGYPALASFAAKRFGHNLTVCLVGEGGEVNIYLYDRYGLYPDRVFERSLAEARSGGVRASASEWREPEQSRENGGGESRLAELYRAYIGELSRGSLIGLSLCPDSDNVPTAFTASLLRELGAQIDEKSAVHFEVSDGGDNLTVFDGDRTIDFWHIRGIIIADLINRAATTVIALPFRAPEALHEMVAASPIPLRKFSLSALDPFEAKARENAARQYWLFDAAAALAAVCDISIGTKKSLSELCDELPLFADREEAIDNIAENRTALLRKFGMPADEGVVAEFDRGRVRMIAKQRVGFSLMAEAATDEEASDLIARAKKRLGRLFGKKCERGR